MDWILHKLDLTWIGLHMFMNLACKSLTHTVVICIGSLKCFNLKFIVGS